MRSMTSFQRGRATPVGELGRNVQKDERLDRTSSGRRSLTGVDAHGSGRSMAAGSPGGATVERVSQRARQLFLAGSTPKLEAQCLPMVTQVATECTGVCQEGRPCCLRTTGRVAGRYKGLGGEDRRGVGWAGQGVARAGSRIRGALVAASEWCDPPWWRP